jgi:flagellar hook assembly protein FlgD
VGRSGAIDRGRIAAVLLLAVLVAAGASLATAPRAVRAAADGRKAVIIVGPASSSTYEYLSEGERIAREAEAQGMDVRRVFTPNASWRNVKQNIQGAHLIVYLGHGNGWPSPYAPFRPESKDGFGLNPCEGSCGTSSPTKYYGEKFIREQLRFGENAVVVLHRACYTTGNAEGWMAPNFDRSLAVERVSNFASGFLDAGAAVVFAYGWKQKVDLPAMLGETSRTMDEIFQVRGTDHDRYDGWIGTDDYYAESVRNPGARIHLDPHPRHGHLRAVTGRLEMTAEEWRGVPPPPDTVAPTLEVHGAQVVGSSVGTGPIEFSPNGDGIADEVAIERTLSEAAWVDLEIRNETDAVVRTISRFSSQGPGESTWDGRNQAGKVVGDGRYRVRLTPRDRAGNIGESRVVEVRVLGFLRAQRASASALHVADGDALAASVTLTSSLRREAAVTWEIRRGGAPVRTYLAGVTVGAGPLTWTWDGRDDAGNVLQDGSYKAVVTGVTPDGTMRSIVPLRLGNWRFTVSDRTPSRGRELRLVARSTERLRGAPRLTVSQPGMAPRVVRMRLPDPHTAVVTIRLARGGSAGTLGLRISATDAGGQDESGELSLRLR